MSRKSRTGIPYTYLFLQSLIHSIFIPLLSVFALKPACKMPFWIWRRLSLEPSGSHQIQESCTFQDRSFDDPVCRGRFCNINISSEFNKTISWAWRVKWVQGIGLLVIAPVGAGVYPCTVSLSLQSSKWYLTDGWWFSTQSSAERVGIPVAAEAFWFR